MSERISDERLEFMKVGASPGYTWQNKPTQSEAYSVAAELLEARAAIRLLTAALERRVNWSEEDCSDCATGKRCASHEALEAGREWSEV